MCWLELVNTCLKSLNTQRRLLKTGLPMTPMAPCTLMCKPSTKRKTTITPNLCRKHLEMKKSCRREKVRKSKFIFGLFNQILYIRRWLERFKGTIAREEGTNGLCSVEKLQTRRTLLGIALGSRAPWLAHWVLCDGLCDLRRVTGHTHRRRGPEVPPPWQWTCSGWGAY